MKKKTESFFFFKIMHKFLMISRNDLYFEIMPIFDLSHEFPPTKRLFEILEYFRRPIAVFLLAVFFCILYQRI